MKKKIELIWDDANGETTIVLKNHFYGTDLKDIFLMDTVRFAEDLDTENEYEKGKYIGDYGNYPNGIKYKLSKIKTRVKVK